MRISDLPAAINHASFSSQLKQHRISEHKIVSQSQGTTEQVVLTDSLAASDNGYTKQDALLKQWNKEGSFNLYDALNGEKVKLQNPNPSADELKAFQQKLQQNGISTDIDWGDFEFDMKGIGFDVKSPVFSLKPEDFNRKTDYLASRYAAMKDRIQKNFSGERAQQQMKKLDELYQSAAEELAKGYSNAVGGFLEQNGLSGEKERIYQSVINNVDNRAREYEEYLSNNPDFADLKGTEDEWLEQDDEYIASLLRGRDVQNISHEEAKTEHYSQKDLDILGRYVSELTQWEHSMHNMDEERIGLDFALLSMKTQHLRKEQGISSSLDSTLTKMLDGFMSHALDRLDKKLSNLRENGAALHDKAGYAALDRQAIRDVYEKTTEHYKASENMMDAFIYGARYAAGKSLDKMNDGTYRHMNNVFYWTQFFDKSQSGSYPYDTGMSAYERYAMGLNDFKKGIEEGKVRLNMDVLSFKPYSTSSISNLINARA